MPKSKSDQNQTPKPKTKRKTGLGTSAFFQTPSPTQQPEEEKASPPMGGTEGGQNLEQEQPTSIKKGRQTPEQQKTTNQQANKPTSQHTSKPASQQASEPAYQHTSIPAYQYATKTKATYYLTEPTLDHLEEATTAAKKHITHTFDKSKRKLVSKSLLVEAALQIVLEDFTKNPTQSLLIQKITTHLQE